MNGAHFTYQYIKTGYKTHTTCVQMQTVLQKQPPKRIINTISITLTNVQAHTHTYAHTLQ